MRPLCAHNFILWSLLGLSPLAACGGKKGGGSNEGPNGGGGSNNQALTGVKVDFSGATGLLVIDPTQGSGGASLRGVGSDEGPINLSLADGNETNSGGSGKAGEGSLAKVDAAGDVKAAITAGGSAEDTTKAGWCCKPKLPAVKTIAVSPNKEIYLHFEKPFVYREPEDGDWSDVWEQSSGYQCQIFKVKGGTIEDLIQNPPEDAGNLECLDNMHFVDSWQAQRNSVFQFDAASNVYYPGSLPNNGGKMVVYKRSADGKVTEMINSNICVQDFLVTKAGGIFYTGASNCQGGGGSGGGFFRYVSATNSLIEIAREWWNFVFEPSATATGDKAVFFGPDPTSSKTASWDTACLFHFDPTGGNTASQRISPVITCGGDIWSWINLNRASDIATYGNGYHNGNNSPSDSWISEFKSRCESSGKVFAGGGSQISAIQQTSQGDIYVIGQVRKKKEGQISCSLSVKGPHCVIAGIPSLATAYDTAGECQGASGTWKVDDGWCFSGTGSTQAACIASSGNTGIWRHHEVGYNNVASELCGATSSSHTQLTNSNLWSTDVESTVSQNTAAVSRFSRSWLNCQVKSQDGGASYNWTDEYKGLAKVDPVTKTLVLLSSTSEQAINLWLVGDQPYFSAFNTSDGKYYLRKYTNGAAVTIAENFEAYNISPSGEAGKLYYDGLDFSSNAYSFGTLLETAPFTRTIKTGLTGTVKTIVILSP